VIPASGDQNAAFEADRFARYTGRPSPFRRPTSEIPHVHASVPPSPRDTDMWRRPRRDLALPSLVLIRIAFKPWIATPAVTAWAPGSMIHGAVFRAAARGASVAAMLGSQTPGLADRFAVCSPLRMVPKRVAPLCPILVRLVALAHNGPRSSPNALTLPVSDSPST
jgi:hypothetical protein